MTHDNRLRAALKAYRLRTGRSHADLAAELGIHELKLWRWEKKKSPITLDDTVKAKLQAIIDLVGPEPEPVKRGRGRPKSVTTPLTTTGKIEDLREELSRLDRALISAFDRLLQSESQSVLLGTLRLACAYRFGRPAGLKEDATKGPATDDTELLATLEKLAGEP